MLSFIVPFLLSTPLLSVSTAYTSLHTQDLQRRCESVALELASPNSGSTSISDLLNLDSSASSLGLGTSAVEFIPGGTTLELNTPYNHVSCNRPSQLVGVGICRLSAYAPTSLNGRSGVNFELWMPADWAGQGRRRFLGTGNGGIDGCKLFSFHSCVCAIYESLLRLCIFDLSCLLWLNLVLNTGMNWCRYQI